MSGPKKWVSSKVHRKASSKSSLGSNNSGSSPLYNRGVPPSPPIRLPNEDTSTATAMVDFGSGSTLMTQGGPSTICSNSSIDSFGTGLTHSPLTYSPSTTPPKKTWERNYKSFLRKTGIHPKVPVLNTRASTQQNNEVPIKPLPRIHHHSQKAHNRSFSENATNLLSKSHHHLPHFLTHHSHNDSHASLDDLGPDLAYGFEDHSQNKAASVGVDHSTNDSRTSLTAPLSPSKQRESGLRGGTFFKRLRSKTKSTDSLDSTMRKGVDRKSPTNTPPGSVSSTPIHKLSPLVSSGVTALQEGMEKAAMLSEVLSPPALTTVTSLGSHKQRIDHDKQRLDHAVHYPSISPQGDLNDNQLDQPTRHSLNDNQLDQARHRGYSVSMSPSTMLSQTPTTTSTIPPSLFSRVQSMGSNLVIPEEGEPAIVHEEELIREKKKAFTDFHNTGIDSSSAYLGDESSLHKQSAFLSSMAYPAGSAGSKVHSRHSQHAPSPSGAYSLDQKIMNISPSTSLGCVSKTSTQNQESGADFSPERALRSLKGPEHWTKGEKHAILPGVLSMCPIQVLNNIMSKEEEGPSSRPSLTSRGSQGGFGIGSILSQDEGSDSNGWFFADHHQPSPAGGMLPCHGGSVSSSTVPPSAFGKIVLGKATVAPLGMRSFLNEVYGWCTGVFILRQNYLFEYREGDSLNGLPWGYAHLPLAEAYPHKHFTNALHLEFFQSPCSKSGKRSLLLRVESKGERDRWVSLLQSAARMTMHDLYDVDESEGAPEFGNGRYAVVRPARQRDRRKASFSDARYPHSANSQESFRNISSYDSLAGGKSSNPDLEGAGGEYNCALKIIDKKEFWSLVKKGRERADTLVREAAVQTTLAVQGEDTPGFLRLRNIFETGEKLVLELEVLKGTDLFQHVSSRGGLGEVEAAHIMRDLLNCLNVLDQVGIAHRDIKPANLLMCHQNENNDGPRIKLADYGMASFVGVDNLVRGRCGTPGFVAPEILRTGVNGGYGNKVDMFSAGVTLYVMLAGYEPFYGESDSELIDANREARVEFPHADWHTVSIEGRDLIERLLVVDPIKRIGPSEALRHPWITRRATAQLSED